MTTAALRLGLAETLKLADEVIALLDAQLDENEEQRLKLVADRENWCRRRATLRSEASDLGELIR